MSKDIKVNKLRHLALKAKSRARFHERTNNGDKAMRSIRIAKKYEREARPWNHRPQCERSRKPEAKDRVLGRKEARQFKSELHAIAA
jgi:hypothetical protein